MTIFFRALLIGIAAGILDVIPMVFMGASWQGSLATLLHWLTMGILVTYIRLPFTGWLSGMILALMTGIPLAIQASAAESMPVLHLLSSALILGGLLGLIAEKLILNQPHR